MSGTEGALRYYPTTAFNAAANVTIKPITGEYYMGCKLNLDSINSATTVKITFTNTLKEVARSTPVITLAKSTTSLTAGSFAFHIYALNGTNYVYLGTVELNKGDTM